ncbi:hypothetical protein [Oceanobacillus kapialis]|uniref:DUF996 domain-containing protein n=1 Tax=Oceanobacillus kapialis TaxID=481353 RepID=A0ABW5Q049_9BACI
MGGFMFLIMLLATVVLVPVLAGSFILALPGMIIGLFDELIIDLFGSLTPIIIILIISTVLIVLLFNFSGGVTILLFIISILLGYVLCLNLFDHGISDDVWQSYKVNRDSFFRTIFYFILYSVVFCLEFVVYLVLIPAAQLIAAFVLGAVFQKKKD